MQWNNPNDLGSLDYMCKAVQDKASSMKKNIPDTVSASKQMSPHLIAEMSGAKQACHCRSSKRQASIKYSALLDLYVSHEDQ